MNMFSDLFVLSLVRKGWSAFGFYAAWLVIGILAGMVIGGLVGVAMPAQTTSTSFSASLLAGNLVAILLCTGLAILICRAKGLIKEGKYIGLIIGTAVLSALGGGLLGLIIPAYLTTLPKFGQVKEVEPAPAASA